jgi:3-hydroxyisobutyrate dehydrogenase
MLLKLIGNSLFATQALALAESLTILKQSGVEVAADFEILSQLPMFSPAAIGVGNLMLHEKFSPLFPIALVEKDLRYFAALTQNDFALSTATLAHFGAHVQRV